MSVILIVEDDVFIRQLAELIIEDCGHNQLSACDGDEALSFLRSTQHIDALFTDIRLTKASIDGFVLAHEAIKHRPGLRVLYATGNSITAQMEALFVEGSRFLQKPYTQHQLQSAVDELFGA